MQEKKEPSMTELIERLMHRIKEMNYLLSQVIDELKKMQAMRGYKADYDEASKKFSDAIKILDGLR